MNQRTMPISDIRSMTAEVMTMTRAEMQAVVYDEDAPVIVRRFADSLLRGNVKDMVSILNQTLGTPVERHMVATHNASPFEQLTVDELRGLLALCESIDEEEVIEVGEFGEAVQ